MDLIAFYFRFFQSSKVDICFAAFISLSGLSIYLVISICHCLILSILNKTLLLGLPVTYIQCLPASSTFVLFNSQSDDDEIPRNFEASELFKYLSIKKRIVTFLLTQIDYQSTRLYTSSLEGVVKKYL